MTRVPSLSSLPREVLLSPHTLYMSPCKRLCRYVPYSAPTWEDQALFVYVDSADEKADHSSKKAFTLSRPNWRILKVVNP